MKTKDTHEILISGDISYSEIEELNKKFIEIKIKKMETKGVSPMEFVQIVFNDFNIISFTRDFILGIVLTGALIKIRKIVTFLKERNKNTKYVSIEIRLKSDNKTFFLNMVSEPDRLDLMIEIANKELLFIADKAENNCTIHINWNKNGDAIEIQYL